MAPALPISAAAVEHSTSTTGKAHAAGTMHDDILRILWREDELSARVTELGRQLSLDYAGKAPAIIGVLKGAFLFTADLVRAIEPCPRGLTVDFVRASSYGSGTESSGSVKLKVDLDPALVRGRHVLLVEDIVDTALTITTLKAHIEACGAASVRVATLLDKHERRKVDYSPDYVGFVCPNEFVVGYGLDYDEAYRSVPYIGVLKPAVYSSTDE